MALPRLDAETKLSIARDFTITDKVSGRRVLWEPTAEQERAARASDRHSRLYVAKPRQVYMSTWFTFEDVLDTWTADTAGEQMTTGIVIDTDAKATARWEQAKDFCEQLQARGLTTFHARRSGGSDPASIEFPNGSKIVCFTAGGNRAGSSLSFQRYHFTEIPYWPRATEAFGSLMPALAREGGRVVIETTLDIKEPLARELWVNPNEWFKLFFSVEDHEDYRHDPASISDERWLELQAEGYTDRAAAAWFARAVENEFGGDETHAYRLYPQKPEHMIQSAAGRFIGKTPIVLRPLRTLVVEGVSDAWHVEIYREPAEGSGQYVIGVDTSAGKELDRSTVVAIDKADGQICAAFASDIIWGDDLGLVAKKVQDLYVYVPPADVLGYPVDVPDRYPEVIIEDNGIGTETWHAFLRHGGRGRAKTMTEPERLAGLLHVKRRVEAGDTYGPAILAEECDSLHRDDLGRFKGRKDFCMALGMAYRGLEASPYITAPLPEDRSKAKMAQRLKKYQRKVRQRR